MKDRSVWIVIGVFSALLALGLVWLLADARAVDTILNGKVPTNGDDHEYQRLAINLRYGVGYTGDLLLPIETYKLDLTTPFGRQLAQQYHAEGNVKNPAIWNFYRAPGYPMLLSIAYSIFGDSTLTARYLAAVLIWAVAMLTLITGAIWAGWRGALAGGIVGIIYLLPYVIRNWGAESLMTEVPTTFWMALFGLCFVLFQKTGRVSYFLGLAVILVCLIYTRANMLLLLPLFVVYFAITKVAWRRIILFSVVVAVPVGLWTAFASVNLGSFVSFTTQGAIAFPQYNNISVIEGVGPDRLFQGEWNPGYHLESGRLVRDNRFMPKEGENGYLLGLSFWRDNPTLLPELFYLKLRAGFWTKESLAGIYTAGLCFLFFCLGLRTPRPKSRLLPNISSRRILNLQVILGLSATLLMTFAGKPIYPLVLAIYATLILLALFRPYGDVFRLPAPSPTWFLVFVLSHFATTVLYMGVRFNEPLDPLLCMFGIYGLIALFEVTISRIRRKRNIYQPPLDIAVRPA